MLIDLIIISCVLFLLFLSIRSLLHHKKNSKCIGCSGCTIQNHCMSKQGKDIHSK